MRHYLVQHNIDDKSGAIVFIKAPGPKQAVARLANKLLPHGKLYGSFKVTTLKSGIQLGASAVKTYYCSMGRTVERISAE
jgi:hypothetical protein